MRRLFACAAVAAMTTAALTAPATSAQSDEADHDFTITGIARSASKPVPDSAVMSAAARSTVRAATWTDGADGPRPARDLRRLSVTHNRANGQATAVFRLGAKPKKATTAAARMLIGTLNNGACYTRAQLVSLTHKGPAQWARHAPNGTVTKTGNATYSRDGATVRLRAKAKALQKNWNCAFAQLTDPAGDQLYDSTGYVRLQVPPRPKLTMLKSTHTHSSAAVGRWKRVKIHVSNRGDVKAKRVRVRLTSPKGTQVKPRTLSFKPIAVGGTRAKAVRVKLTKRSTKTIKFVATAPNAPKARTKIVLHPKPKPLPKNLVGRYFWGVKSHDDYAWDNRAVTFVNKKFAYVGFPKRGMPKCGKVTKNCKRYTYKKKNGKVRVGARKGTFRKGKLVLGGLVYNPTKLPKPGARWNLTLVHRGFNGCELFQACSTWTDSLTLRKNGTFTWKHSSVHTLREVGMPAGIGRYQVKRKGHLVLRYRGGKTRHTTIAIDTDNKRRPDPYGAGVLINDINFYP